MASLIIMLSFWLLLSGGPTTVASVSNASVRYINLDLAATTVVDFNVSQGSLASVPISRSIAALSIEFCYITDYLGDIKTPNQLSLQLLQNVQDILGAPPIIRVGGDTQDVARYNALNNQTLTNVFETGNTEAISVTYNANLFQVLNNNVPSAQQFVFGLNFGQGNLSYALAEVAAVEAFLQPYRLYAYELGNEPDYYPTSKRNPPWNIQTYAQQQVDWLSAIKTEITHDDHGFQLGAFAQEPVYQGNFSLAELTKLDIPGIVGNVKSFSDHTYPYSICSNETAALVSLPNLMSHINTIMYFQQWQIEIAAAQNAGIAFHMGETGSVSCHGKDGVSNTLGAALWEIDYMLHGATLGFQGVFFHMGTPFYYSAWQPVAYEGIGPAQVRPAYYSYLFMADIIANIPKPTIFELSASESDNLALYAIYNNTEIAKLVVLNLDFYNDTAIVRPKEKVDVQAILGQKLTATRFTGPLSITTGTENITWAGQSYSTGSAFGSRLFESWHSGVVEVAASEAVIIERA